MWNCCLVGSISNWLSCKVGFVDCRVLGQHKPEGLEDYPSAFHYPLFVGTPILTSTIIQLLTPSSIHAPERYTPIPTDSLRSLSSLPLLRKTLRTELLPPTFTTINLSPSLLLLQHGIRAMEPKLFAPTDDVFSRSSRLNPECSQLRRSRGE